MTALRITGGTVHDPANGIDGEVRDICVLDGRIVASLPDDAPRLDARDMVVMAGGIDIHAHVASASVNVARRMLPEEHAVDPVRAPALVRDRDARHHDPALRDGRDGAQHVHDRVPLRWTWVHDSLRCRRRRR